MPSIVEICVGEKTLKDADWDADTAGGCFDFFSPKG